MFIQKRLVTTNSVGCPASCQRLSAVVEGGKQDGGYSRIQSYAAVYLLRGAVHAAMAVGYASSSVSHLPRRFVSGHFGRVVGSPIIDMIIHLLTSVVARVVAQSFCAGRSSLYSPMSVVDIVQTACVSTV